MSSGIARGRLPDAVIPGRAQREPGIHSHFQDSREDGFRVCAKRRIPE